MRPGPGRHDRDALVGQVRALVAHAERLAATSAPEAWSRLPAKGGWTAAQCLEHLSVTAESGSRALLAAPSRPGRTVRSRQPRWLVRLFIRSLEPPARFRTRTAAAFQPPLIDPAAALARFREAHDAFTRDVETIAEVDLHRVCIPSPFAPVHYTPLEWALVVAAHGRRHLWQAERALADTAAA
jgi:hypothetical protein